MVSLYAETSSMRARQVVWDLVVIAWVILWVMLGRRLHELLAALTGPGEQLADLGVSLGSSAERIVDAFGDAPFIGGEITAPFVLLRDAAGDLVHVGEAAQQAVLQLALWSSIAATSASVLLVVVPYLLWRATWVRRAATARHLRDRPGAVRLLALRAAVRRPLEQLHDVSNDPMRDLEEKPQVLAALELRALGLRPPTAS